MLFFIVLAPGRLSTSIGHTVFKCVTCAKDRPVPTEPLMFSSFPARPWERLAIDLFELHRKLIESKRSDNPFSESVVCVPKIFASRGIPDIIISANGPQFSAATFRQFAMSYVCACDEFSVIPSIERTHRTGRGTMKGYAHSEEQQQSTHRSHYTDRHCFRMSYISSRNSHGQSGLVN